MTLARRLLFGIVCLVAVGMDGLRPRHVAAAGSPAPTVSILRNSTTAQSTWPGDFNGDGIIDLASSAKRAPGAPPSAIQVSLGNGNGTFQAPIQTRAVGHMLAVGDFNRDGKADLLATEDYGTGQPVEVFILLGNGNGTFTTRWHVATASGWGPAFGLGADMDGDGTLDVILGDDDTITFFSNAENGTFPDITALSAGIDIRGAVVADFNHDGCPDVAIANYGGESVTIFQCQGHYAFTTSEIPLGGPPTDVTAADLNGDGKVDLVATAVSESDESYFTVGRVAVVLGNGDVTFRAPVSYDVLRGAWKVVVGDFTRDGIVDIATANRSAIYYDALCVPLQTWDSVSILPGTGDGTFTAPSHFSIGNQLKSTDPVTDRNTVVSLAAADLNGDRAFDLVVSNGTVFLNRASDPNWAPTVDAGPDQTVTDPDDHFVHLYAKASDVDQDVLSYRWFDSGGDSIPPVPSPCFSPHTLGVHTYTVVVDDGHGHTASDSVVVDFGAERQPPVVSVTAPAAGEVVSAGHPYLIRWTVTPGTDPIQRFDLMFSPDDGFSTYFITECTNLAGTATSCQWNNPTVTEKGRIQLLAQNASGDYIAAAKSGLFAVRTASSSATFGNGWSHADVGSVGAAGTATYDGFVLNGEGYTVTGSGADIWGTADEFHFAWKRVAGDFSIDTLVDSLQNTNAWAKAGLMIRADAADASAMHASIFVSPSRGIAYQRRNSRGGTTASVAGPAFTAPVWLRMTREGNIITSSYRKRTTDPWTLLSMQTIDTFASAVDVGVAVTSHADGTLATAKFLGVYLQPLPHLTPTAFGGATGSIGGNGTTYDIFASGSDIWGTSDSFVFAAMNMAENRQITVRVRGIGNTDPWAKAGVMIRETNLAGSKHADGIVSPGKGIAMQYRATSGGASAIAVQLNGSAPVWLRLRRFESNTPGGPSGFSTSYSTDGTIWRRLGDVNFTMIHDALIGIAVTSHKAGVETHVVVDDIRIQP